MHFTGPHIERNKITQIMEDIVAVSGVVEDATELSVCCMVSLVSGAWHAQIQVLHTISVK